MTTEDSKMRNEIEKALRSYKRRLLVRGLAMILSAAMLGFGLILLLRQAWTVIPLLIPAIAAGTAVLCLVLAFRYLIRPLRRRMTIQNVARSIENKYPELEDRLVTALDEDARGKMRSRGLWELLIKDAASKTDGLNFSNQMQIEGYRTWKILALVSVLALSVVFFNMGAWENDIENMINAGFIPPEPPVAIEITPGDARLKKGSALNIKAHIRHFSPEKRTLFYTVNDSSWESTELTDVSTTKFKYSFFDVQKPFKYYLQLDDHLSDIFSVSLFEVPEIKRIDLSYRYPEQTNLRNHFERNGGDIWAPVGTRIKLTILTTSPIVQSDLILGKTNVQNISMDLLSDSTAAAYFTVKKDTNYRIRVQNADNLDNAPLPEYYIHALKDQVPTVTLKKPLRDMEATMLEELGVEADIGDDFGLESVQLAVKVNNDPEQIFSLQPAQPDNGQNGDGIFYRTQPYRGTMYLEDLQVKPGDFVTYYIMVKDKVQAKSVQSDMYFIDIKNFETIYKAGTSQQGGGSGGASVPNLSSAQRDIITATKRLVEQRYKLPKGEFEENRKRLVAAQQNVLETVQQVASMAKSRAQQGGKIGSEIVLELGRGIKALEKAVLELENSELEKAMEQQRAAYRSLHKADTLVDERTLQQGNGNGSGGNAAAQNLSELFKDELKDLENKYETLQQGSKNKETQVLNDALQKIKELARRQQSLNEQNRLSQQLPEKEKKREIKKLQRQQEQLRRDTEEAMKQLSESMQKQNAGTTGQAQKELRKASDAMNQTKRNMQNSDMNKAQASGSQALDRLKNLEKQLKKSQDNALKRELDSIKNSLDQIADEQKNLNKTTRAQREPGKNAVEDSLALGIAAERQKMLREEFEQTLSEMRELAGSERKDATVRKQMQNTAGGLKRSGIGERMDQIEDALKKGRLEAAENMQKKTLRDLEKGVNDLEKLSAGLGKKSLDEKLETALEKTQELRKQLEAQLTERNDGKQQGDSQKSHQSNEGGARPEAGQKGEKGDPKGQGTINSGKQGGENVQGASRSAQGGQGQALPQSDIERLREVLWNSKKEMQQVERELKKDAPGTAENKSLQNLMKDYSSALNKVLKGVGSSDRKRLNKLNAHLVDQLLKIEAELATRLQLLDSKEARRAISRELVPAKFEKMLEDYYRSLAGESKKQ